MRRLACVVGLVAIAACGEVKNGAQDATPGSDAPTDAPSDGAGDAPPPQNGNPALQTNVTNGDLIGLCATGTFGWHFIPQTSINVVQLSVLDAGPAGLDDAHDVGIFDLAGTLLARATVDKLSPTAGQFRKVPIAPVALTAGQTYVIAMTNPGQAHTSVPGSCSDAFGHTDQNPSAIVVDNNFIYKGVASEDTTNAPNPTALVFPDQFPPGGTTAFRVGASFEWVPPPN